MDLFILLIFFFFFKQKTAYEMVRCDWSSDVCSSDLFISCINVGAAGNVYSSCICSPLFLLSVNLLKK